MPKHVLVIEDDPDITTLLGIVVREAGYGVTAAGTLAAARAHLTPGALFDLVVVDFFLPDGDALEFCGEVKAASPDLPILMLSGDLSDATYDGALAAGCADLVAKPFDPDTLTRLIRIAVGDMADRRRRSRTREAASRRAS